METEDIIFFEINPKELNKISDDSIIQINLLIYKGRVCDVPQLEDGTFDMKNLTYINKEYFDVIELDHKQALLALCYQLTQSIRDCIENGDIDSLRYTTLEPTLDN